MLSFSCDSDILKYEPILFGDLHFPWQVLSSGVGGVLSGTSLNVTGVDFTESGVEAGGVVYVRSEDGECEGCFEIVSVDSATSLTISVIRVSSDDEAISPPGSSDAAWRISTFRPQAEALDFELTEYLGIGPGNSASGYSAENILDKSALRQASVFGSISGIYTTLASSAEDEHFWKKSIHYRKLFERARQRCRVCLDGGSDGIADVRMGGASVRLVRE
jgi:hypothetical protein